MTQRKPEGRLSISAAFIGRNHLGALDNESLAPKERNLSSRLSKRNPHDNSYRRHSISPLLVVAKPLQLPKITENNSRRLSYITETTSDEECSDFVCEWEEHQVEIGRQAAQLCYRYLYSSLKEWKDIPKNSDLSRLKGVVFSQTTENLREVSLKLNVLGLILERTHATLFDSALENVAKNTPEHLISDSYMQRIFNEVTKKIFRYGDNSGSLKIDWGKVIATFALTAALARDCYRIGKSEYVVNLVKSFQKFILTEISSWIASEGGWIGLLKHFKNPSPLNEENFRRNALLVCQIIFIALPILVYIYLKFYN